MSLFENMLIVIPARGGSKGIPGKNIKLLGGKPLIHYTIEVARSVTSDAHICVSTDDNQIKAVAESTGLEIPFLRPDELATDTSGAREVLLHALDWYTQKGRKYEYLIMLQPTSPYRTKQHLIEAIDCMRGDSEVVCSFTESHASPYFNLYEPDGDGWMKPSKPNSFVRRQDCPIVYLQNGSIFIFKTDVLREKPIDEMTKMAKYLMESKYSIDLDTQEDWEYAEYLLKKIVK